jgi:hypothetical protein
VTATEQVGGPVGGIGEVHDTPIVHVCANAGTAPAAKLRPAVTTIDSLRILIFSSTVVAPGIRDRIASSECATLP